MQDLNFPGYSFRFKSSENKVSVFDRIRKKFVVVTPEEWVRQHVICYLIEEKEVPINLINVEKQIKINGLSKRYDVVVFYPNGSIFTMVECKAPEITINQQTFDQIARYNMALQAEYLMISNGLQHYYCQMDYAEEQYYFLKELPKFQ
ncbi:type I restriction enzyme HsdR N-terminal domain-containing protein [Aquimarina sp. ERC-38]|uniref:type I restriction enzyme HsdR N-terminal domain-containing protein n=1 Tax=Aquimarina sp. ERC-38 TaxID=2949996 RepID=UPI0022481058|nr:type I restriction enzyme HsdR N-terminal domain-containing protein [Aquimarina sp. ERC-38]UZO79800.1 type I restriction enzyme HsdR N-terminal domain-containing protein [Aquimarina sp. ERC-38]